MISIWLFNACASEVGGFAGESPAGQVRRFRTESLYPGRGREAEPQAGYGWNCRVVTKVNLI